MTTVKSPDPATDVGHSKERRWTQASYGLMLGAFCGLAADQLGLLTLLRTDELLLVPALLGAGLALTRLRAVVRFAAGFLLLVLLLVGYTPLMARLMPALARSDRLQPAEAIVVLSATTLKDGNLSARSQERVLHAYVLLRQGVAPRLVLTNATVSHGSQVPAILRQMQMLGMNYPVVQTGPVGDTHDEALEVARLARSHGWRRVILVTQAWHMRRAAAVFTKAGVNVICSPCVEGNYDLHALGNASVRFSAFRDWLHETLGYLMYRRRGWI